MKFLGIDFGTKRVGLAMTDPSAKLAFPHKTIYKTTRDKLFAELLAVIEDERVEGIVLGIPQGPVAADGTEALIVRQIKNFAQRLERRVTLPIHFIDESFSSYDAEETLRQRGLRGEELKAVLDQHAAVCILETFMEAQKT